MNAHNSCWKLINFKAHTHTHKHIFNLTHTYLHVPHLAYFLFKYVHTYRSRIGFLLVHLCEMVKSGCCFFAVCVCSVSEIVEKKRNKKCVFAHINTHMCMSVCGCGRNLLRGDIRIHLCFVLYMLVYSWPYFLFGYVYYYFIWITPYLFIYFFFQQTVYPATIVTATSMHAISWIRVSLA